MKRPRLCTAFVLLVGLIGQGAYADSDGYYCTGPGYLAWETRGFQTDNRHRLTLIYLDDASGGAPRAVVELPPFQLHGMQCEAEQITLYAFTESHTIAVRQPPRYRGATQPADIAALRDRWLPRRFGDTPELRLRPATGTTRFVLATDLMRHQWGQGTEYITLARLLRLTADDHLIDSVIVFVETTAN